MDEIATRRIERDSKDIIEVLDLIEKRIINLRARLNENSNDYHKNFIDIICDEGALGNLYYERNHYKKMLEGIQSGEFKLFKKDLI